MVWLPAWLSAPGHQVVAQRLRSCAETERKDQKIRVGWGVCCLWEWKHGAEEDGEFQALQSPEGWICGSLHVFCSLISYSLSASFFLDYKFWSVSCSAQYNRTPEQSRAFRHLPIPTAARGTSRRVLPFGGSAVQGTGTGSSDGDVDYQTKRVFFWREGGWEGIWSKFITSWRSLVK